MPVFMLFISIDYGKDLLCDLLFGEMSLSKEDNDEKLEFQWGLAGPRCKNPLVRLYKSFTYDGINYEQYDCVYMSKEGSPEPYIGKLVKIWEHKEKFKRVKIQWFFRPSEISYFLKDVKVLKKELFLASGKGLGVVNVNPLIRQ
ncbi:hypothetical protein Leryth_011305 [Lithospermum erythrorhizon]|nr:hypothetical protein Leryth_011305 [Lithospermum erythrorhizon]